MKRSTIKRRNGGAMPYRYVQAGATLTNASAGQDMEQGSGLTIRNQIGGIRRYRRRGGFVPSIMEGFVTATSKYITPLVLFAAYKMVNRPTTHRKKSKSKGKKRTTRRS